MEHNFTPLTAKLKSNISFKENTIKKVTKVLFNLIFGFILFFLGIFLIISTIFGMKDLFLYTVQLFKPGNFLIFSGWIGVAKDYFIRISDIAIGNFILFSGFRFIFQKEGGFKLLLYALLVLLLNFILAIIYYGVLKLK